MEKSFLLFTNDICADYSERITPQKLQFWITYVNPLAESMT